MIKVVPDAISPEEELHLDIEEVINHPLFTLDKSVSGLDAWSLY